jgi:hypothetical protein
MRDDYLSIVGLENSAAAPPSVLLASAYNVISVGISSGNHAHGLTIPTLDGPGRVKPELVVPLETTSWGTAAASSAALVLRGAAAAQGTYATNFLTLKAILLAGATKEEFKTWSRTASRPLDLTYGAGELNLNHSYTILQGRKQTASSSLPVAASGWDLNNAALITVPSLSAGGQFSAVLTWGRSLTENSLPSYSLTPQPLANLSLSLDKQVNSAYTSVDASSSSVDNL